jgi:hypothetical protein
MEIQLSNKKIHGMEKELWNCATSTCSRFIWMGFIKKLTLFYWLGFYCGILVRVWVQILIAFFLFQFFFLFFYWNLKTLPTKFVRWLVRGENMRN